MFRRHVTKFLLASSFALGLAPLAANEAFAQMDEGMMRGGMHHRGGGDMMHMRELNLTEQQPAADPRLANLMAMPLSADAPRGRPGR